jgi:tetratricopeptide (TPR) repeat protein
MEQSDILGNLKGGLGLAGKLAGKGIGEVWGLFKGREDGLTATDSGLYWRRPSSLSGKGLCPVLELLEPQHGTRFGVGMVKNLTMSRAERAFVQACSELVLGKLPSSLERLQEAVTRDAQFTDAYLLMGCLEIESRNPLQAVRTFQKALLCQQGLGQRIRRYLPSFRMTLPLTRSSIFSLGADLLGLNILLALAQRLSGRPDDGLATLNQLLGVMPAEPMALFFKALFHLEAEEFRQAVDALKDLLPDSNLHVANLLLLGKACEGLGDTLTATELYRKALGRQWLDPLLGLDLHYSLGEALAQEGWTRDAEKEFQVVRRESADYLPLLERLGLQQGTSSPVASVSPQSSEVSAKKAQPGETLVQAPPTPPPTLPPATPGQWRLFSEEAGIDLLLNGQPVLIGREEGDLVLPQDTAVSYSHARLFMEDGTYWVEDLNSTNGTWVNRHRLSRKVELHRGDEVQAGNTRLRFL